MSSSILISNPGEGSPLSNRRLGSRTRRHKFCHHDFWLRKESHGWKGSDSLRVTNTELSIFPEEGIISQFKASSKWELTECIWNQLRGGVLARTGERPSSSFASIETAMLFEGRDSWPPFSKFIPPHWPIDFDFFVFPHFFIYGPKPWEIRTEFVNMFDLVAFITPEGNTPVIDALNPNKAPRHQLYFF